MGDWFCGKCGDSNVDDDAFCVACGAARRRKAKPAAAPTPTPTEAIERVETAPAEQRTDDLAADKPKKKRAKERALDAEANYHRAKTAKIVDDLARRQDRDETVRQVAGAAKSAGAGLAKILLWAFVGIVVLSLLLVAYNAMSERKAKAEHDRWIESWRSSCAHGDARFRLDDGTAATVPARDVDQAVAAGAQVVERCPR